MTHGRKKLWQSCSLRAPKSSRLLDSGSFCSHLEEGSLPAAGAGPCRGSGRIPHEEDAQRDATWTARNWGRRTASLRVQKASRDEALGEAAHSLGPGDGQQLIGEAHGLAGGRVKKCKQQVQRSLRQGWETFVTNLNSLTLSLPARKTRAAAGPPQVTGGAP